METRSGLRLREHKHNSNTSLKSFENLVTRLLCDMSVSPSVREC
jgi:hypothetical protein